MKKAALFLLLIISLTACEQNSSSNTKTREDKTQEVRKTDTIQTHYGPQLLPVDEAAKDTSFLNFRNGLLQAIYAKDEKYLLGVLDKNIKIGFGGGHGISNFKKKWQANNYERLWPVLKNIIENGGAFMKDNNGKEMESHIFQAPYVFSNWPDSLDAFTYLAIIKNNINVYKQPATNSEVIAKLSYEIVKGSLFDSSKNKNGLVYIESLDGKIKAYVKPENLYSPVGYRALFGKQNGSWQLQALVSGD